ncbi:hypothetical protein [Kocuria arenosa]|uniref:hypothetical protein n=1 Tax=Kocuria arenosa TaxID=3071446 RepID=UPI0034D71C57
MENLRNRLAAATLAELLVTGGSTTPALARGWGDRDTTDGKVVVHIETYKKNGAKKSVETKDLSYDKAAKRAANKCGLKSERAFKDLWHQAWSVDKHDTKWKVLVCSDENGKKGKEEYVKVHFVDNKEKKDNDKKPH